MLSVICGGIVVMMIRIWWFGDSCVGGVGCGLMMSY